MKFALIGYGKMGKEVERIAVERGHTITLRYDVGAKPLAESSAAEFDVAIHFAAPESVVPHVGTLARAGKNIVVGTTGWGAERESVAAIVQQHKIGLVYASNFSLGVNMFVHVVRAASRLAGRLAEYDVFVHEVHHKDKVDSPSGTALTLADAILSEFQRKTAVFTETSHGKIRPEQLHVTSSRGGTVVGTHTVTFDSMADSIELKHVAKSRAGFALGAIIAAEWIHRKQGLFTIDDVLNDMFHVK